MSNGGVKLCVACGKTMIEEEGFAILKNGEVSEAWLCKECFILYEASTHLPALPKIVEAGVKYDNQKLRFDLVPASLIVYDAAIYTMGAQKYGDDNWKGGIKYRRVLGACGRHLLQRCLGEHLDSESNLPHLAHARWNIGAMLYYDLHEDRYKEFDDMTDECLEALKLLSTWK